MRIGLAFRVSALHRLLHEARGARLIDADERREFTHGQGSVFPEERGEEPEQRRSARALAEAPLPVSRPVVAVFGVAGSTRMRGKGTALIVPVV